MNDYNHDNHDHVHDHNHHQHQHTNELDFIEMDEEEGTQFFEPTSNHSSSSTIPTTQQTSTELVTNYGAIRSPTKKSITSS